MLSHVEVLLLCSFLLSLASFCCGCAGHVEWFLAARVLQALGMAVEPMVWAMTRDYFENPEASGAR
jgi:MFS family permease